MLKFSEAKVMNIAHRGARAFAPENTLAAFAKAKAFGCDMFEMDVRLSRDGVVVVYHDEHLKRCTDVETKFPGLDNYDLCNFDYTDLRKLDAGSWFVQELELPQSERQLFLQSLGNNERADHISQAERDGYRSGEIKIPTLAETLALATEMGMYVNVELKSKPQTDDQLVQAVVAQIQAEQMEDQTLISSFEHHLLLNVNQLNPNIAIATLSQNPIKAPVTYLKKRKVRVYNIGCHNDLTQDGFTTKSGQRYLKHLAKMRKAGFGVNVWTCNDPNEMELLIQCGITGLITDYPNRLAKIKSQNR